ncbi:MAG: hypothetical protein S4CHLAM45_01960 [Chlamydiales bacterium]|nr:hypothetical protein [Chlamydiales bacterium]MCH9620333.1 hypothetical protein [Chlamydiales bacterium]MCH9622319.1 hypothetical protein [Chlamydiales bacterium]
MDSINLKIRAASQIALLGAVTKNLRAINILHEGKKILVNFYYKKINDKEEEIPEIFATEMIAYFEDYDVEACSVILPLSETIPEEGIRIFCRKE